MINVILNCFKKLSTTVRICEKCFSDEIESEEHLLLRSSFYYASRRKLLETIKKETKHFIINIVIFTNFKGKRDVSLV
jgi:hypothetical protein